MSFRVSNTLLTNEDVSLKLSTPGSNGQLLFNNFGQVVTIGGTSASTSSTTYTVQGTVTISTPYTAGVFLPVLDTNGLQLVLPVGVIVSAVLNTTALSPTLPAPVVVSVYGSPVAGVTSMLSLLIATGSPPLELQSGSPTTYQLNTINGSGLTQLQYPYITLNVNQPTPQLLKLTFVIATY